MPQESLRKAGIPASDVLRVKLYSVFEIKLSYCNDTAKIMNFYYKYITSCFFDFDEMWCDYSLFRMDIHAQI